MKIAHGGTFRGGVVEINFGVKILTVQWVIFYSKGGCSTVAFAPAEIWQRLQYICSETIESFRLLLIGFRPQIFEFNKYWGQIQIIHPSC